MKDVKTLVEFEGVDIQIVDDNGEKWVTVRDLGRALGYDNPKDIRFIIDRHPEEFENKVAVCKLHTPGGLQQLRVINYHGVIRAAMLSRTPKAKKFRDWAEEVLFQVMTGTYRQPVPSSPVQSARDDFHALLDIARAAKVPEHLALIETAKAVDARHDVPEVPRLVSLSSVMDDIKNEGVMLEPTELAKRLGVRSAIRMNRLLAEAGLQKRIRGRWEPTEWGGMFCVRHAWASGKKSGYNYKWKVDMVKKVLENKGLLENATSFRGRKSERRKK